MAYDIGPRIGIQGEAEFNKQIKQINNAIRECGSEMKALSSEFDENANSQEALIAKNKNLVKELDLQKQKMSLLQNQYEKQVSKLNDLANAYQKAKSENGELSAQAQKAETAFNKQAEMVSKLSVAVNETQNYINKLDNTMNKNDKMLNEIASGTRDAATGLNKLEEAAKDAGDSLEDIGKKLDAGNLMEAADTLSGAGDKIIEAGQKMTDSFASLEGTTTKVNGYFGLTGEAAEQMGSVVENVFKSGVTDSLESVGDAVITVNNNLKDLDPSQLETLTTQAMTMEEIFGSDMNETMRGVNALMVNFSMDAQEAMDYLIKGSQNGLDKTQELGDNLAEYSGKFSQAGYSAQEYFQLLQNGLEGGAYNLDKVNDSINEVTTRLADGTIEDSMSKIDEKTGEVSESTAGWSRSTEEVFQKWKNGEASQKDVINALVGDISNATSQQEALTKASVAFGTMGEDANLDVIKSLNTMGDAYSDVAGTAQKMAEDTTTPMQKLQAKMNELQLALTPLGEKLLEIATKILPPLVDKIVELAEWFTNLSPQMQAVIGIIAGVIAAFSALAPVITAVVAVIGVLGAGALLPLVGIIAAVVAAIAGIIAVIQNWGAITEWIQGVWETTKQKLSEIWSAIQEYASVIFGALKEFFSGIWNDIKTIVETAVNTIKDVVSTVWSAIQTAISTVLNTIKNVVSTAWNGIKNSVTTAVNSVKTVINNVWNSIRNIVTNVTNSIKNGAVNGFKNMVSGIKNTVSKIGSVIKNGFQSAIDFITGLPAKAWNWGADFMNGLKEGIMSKVNAIIDAVKNVGENIRSFLHFSRPDEGPLRDYETWMPDFMGGLAEGIYKNIDKVQKAARAVSGTINSTITGRVADIAGAAAYTKTSVIVVEGDRIILDGKEIGRCATKYINRTQNGKRSAQGRRDRHV